MEKSADAFRTISEVADDLTLPQHVLRFWETRFPQIRPLKRAGGRRYYRPADVVLLKTIRQLLYDDGYTIKGVQRLLKEQGPRALATPASVDLDLAGEENAAGEENVAGDEHTAGDEDVADTYEAASEDAPQPGLETVNADLHAFHRDGLIEAMATIDECLAILAAARQSA